MVHAAEQRLNDDGFLSYFLNPWKSTHCWPSKAGKEAGKIDISDSQPRFDRIYMTKK